MRDVVQLADHYTFVFQVKSSVRNRSITTERQKHCIWTALYPLWEFAVLEATNERTVAIRTVVDVQEIIVWLNVETKGRGRQRQTRKRKKVNKNSRTKYLPWIQWFLELFCLWFVPQSKHSFWKWWKLNRFPKHINAKVPTSWKKVIILHGFQSCTKQKRGWLFHFTLVYLQEKYPKNCNFHQPITKESFGLLLQHFVQIEMIARKFSIRTYCQQKRISRFSVFKWSQLSLDRLLVYCHSISHFTRQ